MDVDINMHNEGDLELARKAAAGDKSAQKRVVGIADPLIQVQSRKFCRRFCSNLCLQYKCTLFADLKEKSNSAPLCDWGNNSYEWMLSDLCSPKSLIRYRGDNGANLQNYFSKTISSLPFFERWKNHRFGRRIHVPEYIKSLSPISEKCFFLLCDKQTPEEIAQKLKEPVSVVTEAVDNIVLILIQKRKLYLLNRPKPSSLTKYAGDDNESVEFQSDIADHSCNPEELFLNRVDEEKNEIIKRILSEGWKKLSPLEQIVLDALVKEGRKASEFLKELKQLKISISDKHLPEDTNQQQLFYFKRKTLMKLARLCGFKT